MTLHLLVSVPYAFCLLSIGYGTLSGSLISKIGFRAGSHSLFSVLEMVVSSVEAWFSAALDIEEVCLVLVVISCMLWLLILLSLLMRWIGLFLIVLCVTFLV